MTSKSEVNKKIFAKRLRNLMTEFNETVYSLAEIVHLSAATISRYTNAEMAPKITTIEVLARNFNINPAWLMGYDVPKKIENVEEKRQPHPFDTIAAHFEGVHFTDEENEEIKNYIRYLLSKRDKK